MKRSVLLTAILLLGSPAALGQDHDIVVNSVILARANIKSTSTGLISLSGNPAGILWSTDRIAASASHENRYTQFIGVSSANLLFRPRGYMAFGVSVGSFGTENYRENEISSDIAIQINQNLSLGSRFHFFRLRIPSHISRTDWDASIGFLYRPSENIRLGAFLRHIIPIRNGSFDHDFSLHAGMSYRFSGILTVHMELSHRNFLGHSLKLGMEYILHPKLVILLGINSFYRHITSGIRLSIHERLVVSIAAAPHFQLGPRIVFTISTSL